MSIEQKTSLGGILYNKLKEYNFDPKPEILPALDLIKKESE
jgi:hypothetical protein